MLRARIVLAATTGEYNAAIAERLGICVARFANGACGSAAIDSKGCAIYRAVNVRERSLPKVVAEIRALACEPPTRVGNRWSCPKMGCEAVSPNIADAISVSTVRRWPDVDAI